MRIDRISKAEVEAEATDMRSAKVLAGSLCGLLVAQAAAAHTPYLRPTNFAPERPLVTVEAALAETFFVPDFPIRAAGDYWVTGPAGVAAKAEAVTALKELSVIEVPLPSEGTYRISTGDRLARQTKWAKVDGAWKMVRPAGPARPAGPSRFIEETAVPPGAETAISQSFSRVETYVSRGAPSREALKPTGQGLELEPATHPNEAFVGETFKFRLLFDGKPLPDLAFNVVRGGDAYVESRYAFAGQTDAAGAGAVSFAQPGVYVLEADLPPRAEGASQPPARSAQYVLTFEVTR